MHLNITSSPELTRTTAAPLSADSHSSAPLFASPGIDVFTRGATYPGLPPQFAYPAALGDLLASVLAFISIFLVLRNSAYARPMVWVFNVWGTLDLLDALLLRRFMGRLHLWDRLTGFPHFGCLLCWLPTT